MEELINKILETNSFDNLYDLRLNLFLNEKIKKIHYDKIKIGLINIPCGGYGDVIKCIKVCDYLKKWYPTLNTKICSTSKQKYRNIGSKHQIIELKHKSKEGECKKFSDLRLDYNMKFDILLIIPIINRSFDLNNFKKLIPYANNWNTYVMSEYNDIDNEPYDLPIGIGNNNLGLFFDYNFKFKKQRLIKNPYALVYIQPSPEWGVHSRYCFLSYLEMICKKYSKKYKVFEIIIPPWIEEDLVYNYPFKKKSKDIISDYFSLCTLKLKEGENILLYSDDKNKNNLILRGDILPQPREKFIDLIVDSIPDVLLTGDESLVDALTCCKDKTIWYQIAPWKQNLAYNLYLETGNKNYSTFKTTCGTIKGFRFKNDVDNLIKNNDFRIKGKEKFDALLIFNHYMMKDKDFKGLLNTIDKSRYLDTLKKKIKNM